MKERFARFTEWATRGRVRFLWNTEGIHSLRWFWTPWTGHCNHNGWLYLSPSWLAKYWRAPQRR